jgi:hypothetical protein
LTVYSDAGSDPLVFLGLAGLTSFRLVLQTLICKEELLSRAEDKLLGAVNTPEYSVLEFVHPLGLLPLPCPISFSLSLTSLGFPSRSRIAGITVQQLSLYLLLCQADCISTASGSDRLSISTGAVATG